MNYPFSMAAIGIAMVSACILLWRATRTIKGLRFSLWEASKTMKDAKEISDRWGNYILYKEMFPIFGDRDLDEVLRDAEENERKMDHALEAIRSKLKAGILAVEILPSKYAEAWALLKESWARLRE